MRKRLIEGADDIRPPVSEPTAPCNACCTPQLGGRRGAYIGTVRFLLPVIIGATLLVAAPATAAAPDPFSPSAQESSQPARVGKASGPRLRAARKRTVTRELKRLLAAGQIDQPAYNADLAGYIAAKKTLKRLKGVRRRQLDAVIKNLDYVAARGKLTASRLPALFLTLETNRAWWSTKSLLRNGARAAVSGSALTWQYYAGQGLQIQWLGTFGTANSLFKSGQNTRLKTLLNEAAALATVRAGGIAWEYLFKFGGGNPPWVSGMAQATGIQVFARAAQKYLNPERINADVAAGQSYANVAKAALGIYKAAPPEGVRVNTPAGAHYLIYSYASGLRVQNAFTQTIVGLHDYAQLLFDAEAIALYQQGDAQLRVETPTYDTGAWSMYSQARENNLSYHNVTIGFLKELCKRQTDDATAAASGGGLAAGGLPALDPAIYCATEANYRAYLTTPPVLEVRASNLKRGKLRKLNFTLSKISRVSITVRRKGVRIYSRTLVLGHGKRFVLIKARKSGTADVTLAATDLAGNKGSATGEVKIRK